MIKVSFFKKISISSLFLLLAFILYSFPKELKIDYVEKKTFYDAYLVDKNEYVSLVKVACKTEKDDVLGIFNLLTSKDCLPFGFSSYIPLSTKLLDYSIENNILKLNFSKDLLQVKKGYEENLVEMLIYSFTSLDNVEKIMIFIEGEILDKLPNTDRIIPFVLDRSFGINKVSEINTLNNCVSFNVYYLGKNDNDYYYIPVTYTINSNDDVVEIIIKKLKSNNINSSLLTHLNNNVKLISYEIDNQEMRVVFDNDFKNMYLDGVLNETIEYSLVSSFKDSFNVEKLEIVFES